MTKNHGAPGAQKVNVSLSVFVCQRGARSGTHESRMSTHSSKGSNRRVDAPNQVAFCFFEKLFRDFQFFHLMVQPMANVSTSAGSLPLMRAASASFRYGLFTCFGSCQLSSSRPV